MSLSKGCEGKRGPRNSKDAVKDAVEMIDDLYNMKEMVTGVSTGFHDLDIVTRGLHSGQLVAIASYPGMGKTAFATSLLSNISIKNNVPSLFFTFGVKDHLLAINMICAGSKISIHKVRTGFFGKDEWPKINAAAERIGNAPILIDETTNMSINEMRRRLKAAIKNSDIKIVFIDSLDLMKDMNMGDCTDTEEVALCLKEMAMEFNIPIVVTISLKAREGADIPEMCDIWKIGKIDKHMDILTFIYRQEYFNPTEENSGKAELIIAKNNAGPIGKLKFNFIAEHLTFEEDNVC